MDAVNVCLTEKRKLLDQVGYVLCLERSIMNYIGTNTKDELVQLIKEGDKRSTNSCPRRIVVADEGEKLAWHLALKNPLKPQSYYVHSHISDDYMYLKLHQVVNMAEPNSSLNSCSTISVKSKRIDLMDIFEQVSETLWSHIHSLDGEHTKEFVCSYEDYTLDIGNDFKIFKKKFVKFVKEELFSGDNALDQCASYYTIHSLKITDYHYIKLSLQQLMEIAIIPVIQQLVDSIMSCLLDTHIFGFYEIAKLIITGSFLKRKQHHDMYCNKVEKEMKNEFQRLIRVKTYRTQLEIAIDTCLEAKQKPTFFGSEQKLFCFDELSKGALRVVSSATYFLCPENVCIKMDSSFKWGAYNSLLLRGDELIEKRQRIHIFDQHKPIDFIELHERRQIGLYRYVEPTSIEDIQNVKEFSEFCFGRNAFPNSRWLKPIMITIDLKILHYCSCIHITFEGHYIDKIGKLRSRYKVTRLLEKKTLKYMERD